MRGALVLWAVCAVGCYASTRADFEPPPVVVCASDADCMADQSCVHLQGTLSPMCLTQCDSRMSQRCESGAVCSFDGISDRAFCRPGAGLPLTLPSSPDGTCQNVVSCPFGESCRLRLALWELDNSGTCEPVCADDGDCAPGDACAFGTCQAVCNTYAPGSCPAGHGCTHDGECKSEMALARCRDGARCAVGEICYLAGNGESACDDRTDPTVTYLNCPVDEQFYFPTERCYPRSALRPIR